MKHYRHPGEKEDPRPFRPWNIYAVQSVTNSKNGSHQTNEKQIGFQEVHWIDFFAAVQEMYDAVKRKGPQYSKLIECKRKAGTPSLSPALKGNTTNTPNAVDRME